ncbi:uncharacterized protein [Macrobrachium rosenbergii]
MKSLAVVLVTLSVVHLGFCLKCYDGIGPEYSKTVNCYESCLKVYETDGEQEWEYRNCSTYWNDDGCISFTLFGVDSTYCYCNKDLCNSSSVATLTLPFLLLSLLVGLTM